MDLGSISRYADWRDLLADPTIDLIDNCLPPALHAQVTIEALKAGKHVLVEKPIALTTREAQPMVAAAERADRQLLVGQVLPFFPEYAYARKVITSGKYGKLLGGHFKRIISNPAWLKDFFDPKAVGGPLVDLHIHDAHFIRLLCGMPKALFSTGRMRGDVVEFFETQFLYDRGLSVTASGGVINQQGRSFTHGFEIHLEEATLMFDFAVVGDQPTTNIPFTILGPKGKVIRPELPAVDGFVAELTETVRAVRANQPSPLLSGQLALDALELCHKQTQSVRSGKIVRVS
jgi:predicted dehydrogenase